MKKMLIVLAVLLAVGGGLLWREVLIQREQTAEAEARFRASLGEIYEHAARNEREARRIEEESRR